MSEETTEEQRLIPDEAGHSHPAPLAVANNYILSRYATYCLVLYFLVEMYDMITIAPLTALFEQAVCRSYYRIHDPSLVDPGGFVHERSCKIESIQAELAIIRGWKLAFDAVPVFFVAVPFGRMADRTGRKTVLLLSLSGLIAGTTWILIICKFYAIFPLRLAWLSSAFYLCGGGLFGANSMIFAMAADACSEKQRSLTFYYLYSAYLATELMAPWLASITMNVSIWIPFILSIVFLMLCLPVVAKIPDARTVNTTYHCSAPKSVTNRREGASSGVATVIGVSGTGHVVSSTLLDKLKTKNMVLAMPVFLVGLLRPSTLNVLIQYTSISFGWKISNAVILVSEVAAVNLVLFLFLLPWITSFLRARYDMQQQVIDLAVVRTSMMCLAVGAVCLGLAPNAQSIVVAVIVFASGFGCRVSILSLVTSWVGSDVRARLYGVIQIVENFGLLVAEPLLQNVFAASLRLSRSWSSLVFFLAATLYAAVGLCTLLIDTGTIESG